MRYRGGGINIALVLCIRVCVFVRACCRPTSTHEDIVFRLLFLWLDGASILIPYKEENDRNEGDRKEQQTQPYDQAAMPSFPRKRRDERSAINKWYTRLAGR